MTMKLRLMTTSLLLALLPVAATAGTLPLDSDYYWQVQNASTYQSVCEGRISSCDAPDGTYHVINLTTGERRENVSITSDAPSARINVVLTTCNGSNGEDYAPCQVSCPAGQQIVSQIHCLLADEYFDYSNRLPNGDPSLVTAYSPAVFISNGNTGMCNALDRSDIVPGGYMSVSVGCQ